jgi:dolichol-phosphate mannosyltransferase
MSSQKGLVSVVIPAFNEEACVDELARRLTLVSESLSDRYDFEFVVVENGSVDTTFPRLLAIRERDPRFKIIRFSRNFGIEGALTAALRVVQGDAAIIMCADLQDPPEMFPQFIAKWEAGYQNVYGVITRRKGEGWLRPRLTAGFYWLLNRLNQHPVPQNVSDFRLVDRKMYTALNNMGERNRMLRTMWGWIGYKSIGIEYERQARHGGKSTYHLFRNIGFALHGIASSSATPLKIIPMFGLTLSATSFLVLIGFVIRWFVQGVPFGGFGTIVALMLLLFGLLFLFLGIVTEYIGIIYEEVRNRPIFIASETYGLPPQSPGRNGSLTGYTTQVATKTADSDR